MYDRISNRLRCIWLAGLACLLAAGPVVAQDAESADTAGKDDKKSVVRVMKQPGHDDPPKTERREKKRKPGGRNRGRDPFAPTPLLREVSTRQTGQVHFRPTQSPEAVPVLVLRGSAEVKGRSPVALLEVKGEGVFLVREDDTISLQRGRTSTVLKVRTLRRGTAVVEVGTLGKVVVVR